MSIFDKRTNYKPFEYPEVLVFTEAMNKTFWVHSEVDFTADIQDYKVNLTDIERTIFTRSILSISQTEVVVKPFWSDLYKHFPKPEINGMGVTFAESEFRHSEAYSRILEVNGLEEEFELALQSKPFRDYNDFVTSYMTSEDIASKSTFFSLIIENGSLFSKFSNVLAFTRFKGIMKNTSNIIAWTSSDEDIHSNGGIWIINQLRKEGYLKITQQEVNEMCEEYIQVESNLLDWIYEYGELDWFKKEDMLNFVKQRIDDALVKAGFHKVFNTKSPKMEWFNEEIYSQALVDFFAARPVDYTKHDKSITANDLF